MSQAKPMNIVLLMTDQHRADHVSFLSGARMATPQIDRIAGSVGFANCITANPICTPARAALLTGKYTHQIGMLSMSGDLSLQHPTFMRALQQAGYWTAGVGKFHWLQGWPWSTPRDRGHDLVTLKTEIKKYGLDHVWEAAGKQLAVINYCDYGAHLERKGLIDSFRDHVQAQETNSKDLSMIRFTGEAWPFPEEDYVDVVTGTEIVRAIEVRPTGRPFFVFGSFCGPHKPYDPPKSWLERFPVEECDDFIPGGLPLTAEVKQRLYRLRRAYKAMIAVIDDQVGRIFAALEAQGLLDSTVVLFTCDHGEMLGDHGRMSKMQPWRQSVTVPTAIRHPDYLNRTTCASPVELTDVTATILDIAGIDPQVALSKEWPAFHKYVPGRSLLPIVRGETDAIREYAFSECQNEWQMIQSQTWKYIRYLSTTEAKPREELYDLANDPDELRNRAAAVASQASLIELRLARERIMDLSPSAQLVWAPYRDQH